jgi:transposase
MGNPRKIKTAKEALREIGSLEDEHCSGCKIKSDLRKQGVKPHGIQEYCMSECKIGRRIKALGGILEYGAVANTHFKAPALTKEKYIDLKDDGLSDSDIRKKFNISRITLTRRKSNWGLNKIREYIIPSLVLKNLTKEELEELSKQYSDQEIADQFDVSKVTIMKRRKQWGISKEDHLLINQFTLDEYKYLSNKKSMLDRDIAELWDISPSSLLYLKKEWGVKKDRKIPKPAELEAMGLTKERMIELVPNHNDKEIAGMYGLYETTVTKHRKRLGVSHTLRLAKNRIKPEQIKELIDLGLKRQEIADRLDIHKSTLTDLIKQFKEKI